MELKIKKLEVNSESTKGLPLWYNFIIYNQLETDDEKLIDAKENAELGGYHMYHRPNKPISKLIDYSTIEFNAEDGE